MLPFRNTRAWIKFVAHGLNLPRDLHQSVRPEPVDGLSLLWPPCTRRAEQGRCCDKLGMRGGSICGPGPITIPDRGKVHQVSVGLLRSAYSVEERNLDIFSQTDEFTSDFAGILFVFQFLFRINMSDHIFDFPDPHTLKKNPDGIYTASLNLMELDKNFFESPSNIPPLPPQFFAPIGAILVQWGCFESIFDSVLVDFELFNDKITENLQLRFIERRNIFQEEAKSIFGDCSVIFKKIHHIMEDIPNIYRIRNLLAYGKLNCRFKFNLKEDMTNKSYVSILVNGKKNKKDVTLMAGYLKKIFYNLSHYTGWIEQFRAEEFQFEEKFDLIEYSIVKSYLDRIN